MNSRVVLAYSTFPSQQVANEICTRLVDEGLIACANLVPITAIYKWEKQLKREQEMCAILKTTELKKAALMDRYRAIHPYENPCLVFLSVEDGLPEFLNWVELQTL